MQLHGLCIVMLGRRHTGMGWWGRGSRGPVVLPRLLRLALGACWASLLVASLAAASAILAASTCTQLHA